MEQELGSMDFESAVVRMGNHGIDLQNIITGHKGLPDGVKAQLAYLYNNMPLSDAVNYPFELYLEHARHGYMLQNLRRGWNIPEDIFLQYVLFHRVNNEQASCCRPVFFGGLEKRVQGKTMMEAAVEVNLWCGENVSYQQTDDRTASALAVYKAGYGRCGEESVFAVNALRSVGIPARQVYAPRWSHCDDNHAWVECWCDGEWYFLGACEPDASLNRGWFISASSRAVMVHSGLFGTLDAAQNPLAMSEGIITRESQLSRYALTKDFTINVTDENGGPVEGAGIELQILNYGEYHNILRLESGKGGSVQFKVGKGSIHLWASKDGKAASCVAKPMDSEATLVLRDLSTSLQKDIWQDIDFTAPEESRINAVEESPAQKKTAADMLKKAKTAYEKKLAEFTREGQAEEIKDILYSAYGNKQQVLEFFENEAYKKEHKLLMLRSLSVKDYRDLNADVLYGHMDYALRFIDNYPEDIAAKYLLSPRVFTEPLSPYREFILNKIPLQTQEKMAENPDCIMEYINSAVAEQAEQEYYDLITLPVTCLEHGCGSALSKNILFVAVARTLGIAARLNPADLHPEYYKDGVFVRACEKYKPAKLRLVSTQPETVWTYRQNWSVAVLRDGRYHNLDYSQALWQEGTAELSLNPGSYRLLTANRLLNGNISGSKLHFDIGEGEEKTVEMKLRSVDLEQMLACADLHGLKLTNMGSEQSIQADSGSDSIYFWLDTAEEPTEHILNELYEEIEHFRPYASSLNLVIQEEKQLEDPTLSRLMGALKGVNVLYDKNMEVSLVAARRMYREPGVYPLIIAADDKGKGIFGACGYNVGTAGLLFQILERRS